ncbi:MAG: hypothetical protein RR135_03160 [Oscillospiraceae bacterium]
MKRTVVFLAVIGLLLTACGTSSSSKAPVASVPSSNLTSAMPPISSEHASTPATPSGIRVGLGVVATTDESKGAGDGANAMAQANVAVCALAVDDKGTILSVKFDTVQTKIGFDVAGALMGDVKEPVKTKKELGNDYGMKAASGIGKEWYEQINALEKWMLGQTVGDVLAMKVYERDAHHTHVPEEEDLKTSVTISVTDQLRALEKAFLDAK